MTSNNSDGENEALHREPAQRLNEIRLLEARQERLSKVFRMVAAVLAVVGLGLGATGLQDEFASDRSPAALTRMESRLAELESRVDIAGARPSPVAPGPSPDGNLAAIAAGQQRTEERLAQLESALAPDLPRALQIPLLRRDIDNLQRTMDVTERNLRDDLEGTRTLVFATIVVIALGVLAQAVQGFFRREGRGATT